jgi:CRP/FNR family transcriptional regulator
LQSKRINDPDIREVFSRCDLWANEPEEIIDSLLSASKTERLDAGQVVLDRGDDGHFIVVIGGRVRTSKSGGGGHEFSFTSATAGEVIALVHTIRGVPLDASFLAAEDSIVVLVPISALHAAIEKAPAIAYRMALMFADRFHTLMDTIILMDSEVHVRLASFILTRSRELGGIDTDIQIGMSRRELASRIGTVPETLSRAVGKLRDEGLISTNGRRFVTILNRPALEALLPGH